MSKELISLLSSLDNPEDEHQLQQLDAALQSCAPHDCGKAEIEALLNVFERFPDNDGFGVFWGIVHLLEACSGYEVALHLSAQRCPNEFNLTMINRLLNSPIIEADRAKWCALLHSVSTRQDVSANIRADAQDYLDRHTSHQK